MFHLTFIKKLLPFQLITRNLSSSIKQKMALSIMKNNLKSIFLHSVESVSPARLIQNVIIKNNSYLRVKNVEYELKQNVFIVGFGKAVLGMTHCVANLLEEHIQGGILSVPVGVRKQFSTEVNTLEKQHIEICEGAMNNLPDKQSLKAAIKIEGLVKKLDEKSILLVLISGGGSALLPLPTKSVTLEEKTSVIQVLASAGANIKELNTVRKKLSELKGGGLARIAEPVQMISLILSDVIGDPLDIIASGPTVENSDKANAALEIITTFKILSKIPTSVRTVLCDETSNSQKFPNVQNVIVGNNIMALHSAADKAKSLGYFPVVVSDSIQGCVTEVCMLYIIVIKLFANIIEGNLNIQDFLSKLYDKISVSKLCDNFWLNESYIQKCVEALKMMKGVCFILGGEPTVLVQGKGKGGRNQELSLRLAFEMHKMQDELKNLNIMCLSAGTDGIDGPTDAAGAFSYSQIIEQAIQLDLKTQEYLTSNDSYNFYKKLKEGKDLIFTGHTGTNVMDVHLIMIEQKTRHEKK